MEILEQIDDLVQSVENRMRQLVDENESLREILEREREDRKQEIGRMELKLGALLSRLRNALGEEGQDRAG
jgi:ElaB/YqjD/DUF883 family membrane-anchored ribosome-binding protein